MEELRGTINKQDTLIEIHQSEQKQVMESLETQLRELTTEHNGLKCTAEKLQKSENDQRDTIESLQRTVSEWEAAESKWNDEKSELERSLRETQSALDQELQKVAELESAAEPLVPLASLHRSLSIMQRQMLTIIGSQPELMPRDDAIEAFIAMPSLRTMVDVETSSKAMEWSLAIANGAHVAALPPATLYGIALQLLPVTSYTSANYELIFALLDQLEDRLLTTARSADMGETIASGTSSLIYDIAVRLMTRSILTSRELPGNPLAVISHYLMAARATEMYLRSTCLSKRAVEKWYKLVYQWLPNVAAVRGSTLLESYQTWFIQLKALPKTAQPLVDIIFGAVDTDDCAWLEESAGLDGRHPRTIIADNGFVIIADSHTKTMSVYPHGEIEYHITMDREIRFLTTRRQKDGSSQQERPFLMAGHRYETAWLNENLPDHMEDAFHRR